MMKNLMLVVFLSIRTGILKLDYIEWLLSKYSQGTRCTGVPWTNGYVWECSKTLWKSLFCLGLVALFRHQARRNIFKLSVDETFWWAYRTRTSVLQTSASFYTFSVQFWAKSDSWWLLKNLIKAYDKIEYINMYMTWLFAIVFQFLVYCHSPPTPLVLSHFGHNQPHAWLE